jgi:hypothetical protein
MKYLYLPLFVLLLSFVPVKSFPIPVTVLNVTASPPTILLHPADSLSWMIIPCIDKTYGYNIFLKGKMLIHQPSIPCLKGNKGFSSREDAVKTALLVIKKIRKGVMPPTLTVDEMKKAGIVF